MARSDSQRKEGKTRGRAGEEAVAGAQASGLEEGNNKEMVVGTVGTDATVRENARDKQGNEGDMGDIREGGPGEVFDLDSHTACEALVPNYEKDIKSFSMKYNAPRNRAGSRAVSTWEANMVGSRRKSTRLPKSPRMVSFYSAR